MPKQIIDISRSITAVILALFIVLTSSYNTSLVILEPQTASFKVCQNRLAIVLNKEAPATTPSKTNHTTDTDLGAIVSFGCTSLFFSFIKSKTAPEYNGPSIDYTFLKSIILTGFTNEILRPPRF
ncbi:hypothetical protein [Owenweeksia hongkongensis]|uniref:hypothetical protein n=1 Tax=Owenweeksia hongkongensis TaxID=253245 RepID=UPI003A8CBE91